jgi:hypothetical protein
MSMNPNINLKLDFNPAALIKLARQVGPTLAGLAVVAVFGYTGWIINRAFNVPPATSGAAAPAEITFDQSTISALKSLQVVPGQVPVTNLGASDPFGN